MSQASDDFGVGYDVCTAAYAAARPPAPTTGSLPGVCARCARPSVSCTPVSKAISRTFTGFDRWADPVRPSLCFVCAWVYRTPQLRSVVHLVTTAPTLQVLSSRELGSLLDGPLPANCAVVVPLRPGRKHLFPHAQWGRVCVDDAALTWTGADALALQAMRRLRSDRFGPRMLAEPAPPFGALRKVARARWPRILEDWDTLDRWRGSAPWWELGVRSSVAIGEAA